MGMDEAIEAASYGRVSRRPGWPDGMFLYPDPRSGNGHGRYTVWRVTHDLALPDTVADDWQLIGRVQ